MEEEVRRIHGAHRDYYLWLAEEANKVLLTQEHAHWLERLQAEDDNLRAALEWSRDQPNEAEALARLVAALEDYWAYTGRFSEGRQWAAEALADRERVPSRYRIRMLFTAGRLALELGDYQEAIVLLDESLALARREGDRHGEAEALSNKGYVVQAHGDTAEAVTLHTEALARWRAIGDLERVADALTSLGIAAVLAGDLPRAITLFEESIPLCHATNNRYYLTDALLSLGFALFLTGNLERARAHLSEGLTLAQTYGTLPLIGRGLDEIAFIAGMSGQPDRAVRLLGASASLRERHGFLMIEAYRHLYDQLIARTREALGEAAMGELHAAGATLSTEQAIAYARETIGGGA